MNDDVVLLCIQHVQIGNGTMSASHHEFNESGKGEWTMWTYPTISTLTPPQCGFRLTRMDTQLLQDAIHGGEEFSSIWGSITCPYWWLFSSGPVKPPPLPTTTIKEALMAKRSPPSSCPSCYRCGGTTCSGIGNQSPSSHWLAWMDAVWMNDLFWGTDRREGQCGCLRRREESSS